MMHHPIFSVVNRLNSPLRTPEGINVGTLQDIICNKDSGKITYLILKTTSPSHFFALHHSFFYLGDVEDEIIFEQKLGREDHDLYLDLPEYYANETVLRHQDFIKLILPNIPIASHRSDNETLF